MLKAADVVARAVHICKIPKVDYEIAQALMVNRLQAEQLVKTWMARWKQLSGSNSVTVTVEWKDTEIAIGETTIFSGDKVTLKTR